MAEDPLPGSAAEPLAPAGSSRRHPHWRDVPAHLWQDWRWQRRYTIRTVDALAELLLLAPRETADLRTIEQHYRFAIPPYYLSLMDVDDLADPIRLQSVPAAHELSSLSDAADDPLEEEEDSPVPGLTHRYPDRVLMVTTNVCAMYCRFCTRKRLTMACGARNNARRTDQAMLEYVRAHDEVADVILSGGDPLLLPPSRLGRLLTELAAIEHVDVIRIGTRVPVTLPQRVFDPGLVDLLRHAGKVWIQTHFNHPVEITPESARACALLVAAGIPVGNQTVLLKGVNDSVATLRALSRGLLRIKVRPYYLFHCDPVAGASHFRTSIWKGIEIVEGLRGHISGLGVPTYVVDGLRGAGKVPLMPNYLVSASDDAVVLRNFEGLLFRYAPRSCPDAPSGAAPSEGVSSLLSGSGTALVPEGTPRLRRRAKREKERE